MAGVGVNAVLAALLCAQCRLAGARSAWGALCRDNPFFMVSLTQFDADGVSLPAQRLDCPKIKLGGHCATAWLADGCKFTCGVCTDGDLPPPEKQEEVDHYRMLGLGASADAKAIQKSYRQMAKKYHPDKSTLPHAGKLDSMCSPVHSTFRSPLVPAYYDNYDILRPTKIV
jgi:hypothetical protein